MAEIKETPDEKLLREKREKLDAFFATKTRSIPAKTNDRNVVIELSKNYDFLICALMALFKCHYFDKKEGQGFYTNRVAFYTLVSEKVLKGHSIENSTLDELREKMFLSNHGNSVAQIASLFKTNHEKFKHKKEFFKLNEEFIP